jgi:single-strand DNA-binding protein
MASLNRVMLIGNLGQDPELRYTQNQSAVVTLSVATTDVRMQDGQRQEFTEWHRVVVWGKQAENCSKYLTKGRPVFIEGRIQTRSWEDKQGQKRYTTEVVAQNVKFLGSASRSDSPGASSSYGQNHEPQPQYGSGSSGNMGGSSEVPSLDEIPF